MVRYLEIFAFSTLTKMLECHCLPTCLNNSPSFVGRKKHSLCSHASNRSAVSSRWFITSAWELHQCDTVPNLSLKSSPCVGLILRMWQKQISNMESNKNSGRSQGFTISMLKKRFHFAHGPRAKWSFSAASWLRSLSCCACWLLVAWFWYHNATGKNRCGGVKQIKKTNIDWIGSSAQVVWKTYIINLAKPSC